MESISQSLKLKTDSLKENRLKLKASKPTVSQVNAKAEYIASKFSGCGGQQYIPFFRKVVWHLPEKQIDDILSRSPSMFYFIGVCKSEMGT